MTDFAVASSQEANTTTAGAQWNARIASLANGGWVVAWNAAGAGGTEVHAQVFDAAGAKSGSEITVFSAAGNPPGTAFTIGDVAGLSDGSFVVTATTEWLVSPPIAAPYQLTMYGQRVTAAGQLAGAAVQVESHVQSNDYVYGAGVVSTPGGGWATVLQDASRIPPFTVGSSLHYFDAAGTPLATTQLAGGGTPILAEFPDGNVLQGNFNWSPGPTTISWQVLTPTGQIIASERTSTQNTTVQQTYVTTAMLSSGIGVVLYAQDTLPFDGASQISWHVQFVDALGQAVGGDRVIDFGTGGGSNVAATGLADGGFEITWTQPTGTGVLQLLGRHFDANANPAGDVQVLDTDMSPPDQFKYGEWPYRIVATPDGGFEVVSSQSSPQSGEIQFTKYQPSDASGAGAGGSGHIDVTGGITQIPDGSWTISGTAGIDQVAFAGAHTQYTVTHDSVSGPGGTDTLSGIERIRFADGFAIALDVDGNAGEAYRLYKAAFDRAPDFAGLGFQMNDLDMGYSLAHVAQNFIDSPEFQSRYGASLSNTEFITLLYEHVLGREPEAAGLQYHLNEFAQGDTRANMLTHFSESPENKVNVIGQIGDGMLYIPYV